MPSKTKLKRTAIAAKSAALPYIPNDQFISGPTTGQASNAASLAYKKALIERGRAGIPPESPRPTRILR